MLFTGGHSTRYHLVGSSHGSEEALDKPEETLGYPAQKTRRRQSILICVAGVIIVCLAIGLIVVLWQGNSLNHQVSTVNASPACSDPSTRREWRSLSRHERKGYLAAVKCLRETPSRLGLNQSLYDFFPWVHVRVGGYSHGAAAFLAWHRYFIHTYERALREQCHYQGDLTYWNWALDWEDVTKAPVWDSDLGFGGNGDASLGRPIVEGHCVVDGPFAMLDIPYLDETWTPHCLSRGFESGESLGSLSQMIRPQALETLFRQSDYEKFNLGLENGAHIAIPRSIRGDFALFTAPSDPIFFLHHTQLDRLWWTWQRSDSQDRMMQCRGLAAKNSTENATLDDIVPMGGLAPDIKVSDIIRTDTERLCYIY